MYNTVRLTIGKRSHSTSLGPTPFAVTTNYRRHFMAQTSQSLLIPSEIPKTFNKFSLITHPLFYSVTNICTNTMPVARILNVSTSWSTYYKMHLHSLTQTWYKQTFFSITLRTGNSSEDFNVLRSSTLQTVFWIHIVSNECTNSYRN